MRRRLGWALIVPYVAVVGVLAAACFSDPDGGFTWTEAVLMVVTLPAVVPALPLVYVGGAAAWNLSGADDGGPMWPVTLTYTLIFLAVAVVNVWLLTGAARLLRRERSPART